jgi:hypothetical protein
MSGQALKPITPLSDLKRQEETDKENLKKEMFEVCGLNEN